MKKLFIEVVGDFYWVCDVYVDVYKNIMEFNVFFLGKRVLFFVCGDIFFVFVEYGFVCVLIDFLGVWEYFVVWFDDG